MVSLYRRGMELVAGGPDDVDERNSEAAEFKEITKRLWGLLDLEWSSARSPRPRKDLRNDGQAAAR